MHRLQEPFTHTHTAIACCRFFPDRLMIRSAARAVRAGIRQMATEARSFRILVPVANGSEVRHCRRRARREKRERVGGE